MISLKSGDLLLPSHNLDVMRQAFQMQANCFGKNAHDAYPDPDGIPELRMAIQEMTGHWQGNVLITNSATEATYLALKLVASEKGKRLAIQVPCYFGVLRQAKELGFEVIPWENIKELDTPSSLDGVLLTSNFTPPTGQSMSLEDKRFLAEIADRQGAFVIEDNPYDPLWFKEGPTAIPSDPERTIHVGSVSKITSPQLRLGFLRAQGNLFKKLRSMKITLNLSSQTPLQWVALAGIAPHPLSVWRNELQSRAAFLRGEIKFKLKIETIPPQGGSFLCLPLKMGDGGLLERASKAGLGLDRNDRYYPDGNSRPYLRLHYGAIGLGDIPAAVDILRQIL